MIRVFVLALTLPIAAGGQNPALTLADAHRLFYNAHYEESAALAESLRASGGQDLANDEVRTTALLFGADYAGGWVFAYGPRVLFASHDGGRSWRKLRRPGFEAPVPGGDEAGVDAEHAEPRPFRSRARRRRSPQ